VHKKLLHLVALCLSIPGFLDRKSAKLWGIPNLVAPLPVIAYPSSLTQKRLKLTEREALRIVHGAIQKFFPLGHDVTICSYISHVKQKVHFSGTKMSTQPGGSRRSWAGGRPVYKKLAQRRRGAEKTLLLFLKPLAAWRLGAMAERRGHGAEGKEETG